MVSPIPREKLKEIVEKNGDSVLHNPSRCEGLLKDHCGSHRREISAIVGALEERVPMELMSSWQTAMTPEAMRARMVQRLEENRGLAQEVAAWTVDTWSYALGIGLERQSDRLDDKNASILVSAGPATAAVADRMAGDRTPSHQVHEIINGKSGGRGESSVANKTKFGAIAAVLMAAAVFALSRYHRPPSLQPAPQSQGTSSSQGNQPATPATKPSPAPASTPRYKPKNQYAPESRPAHQAELTPAPLPASKMPVVPLLPVGTVVEVRLNAGFNSDDLQLGDTLRGTVIAPLTSAGEVLISPGTIATLRVREVDESGRFAGRSRVAVALESLNVEGRLYAVNASPHIFEGRSQTAHAAERGGLGAAIGGVGGFLGGKLFHHAKVGTLAGAGAGGVAGVATGSPLPVHVPAETVVTFRLSRALVILSGDVQRPATKA